MEFIKSWQDLKISILNTTRWCLSRNTHIFSLQTESDPAESYFSIRDMLESKSISIPSI